MKRFVLLVLVAAIAGGGYYAYRNQRTVLLDLAGWDARRDARAVSEGKAATEREQRRVFTEPAVPVPPAAGPTGTEADA